MDSLKVIGLKEKQQIHIPERDVLFLGVHRHLQQLWIELNWFRRSDVQGYLVNAFFLNNCSDSTLMGLI